jgi:hypothetical protein
LCYPRRVGTVGERRAARYISRQLAALGLTCWRERFTVSFFPAEIGNRLIFAGCVVLAALAAAMMNGHPLFATALAATGALLVNAPWRVQHWWAGRAPHATSENVFAALPAAAGPATARVVFLAHYDTKSQWLPTGVRVALVTTATVCCWALALLGFASAVGVPAFGGSVGWLAGAAIGALVGLLINFTGNRCPGALDNGSAVGTLLELARWWRPETNAPVEAVWVATGSEEVELDGARHLLRAHAAWWEDLPTLIINLESVGAGKFVYLAGEPNALALAQQTAEELGITHAPLSVLGAGMDHEPFAAQGQPAVSILGDVVRKSFAMHSRRDNLSIIEGAALDRAGRLAASLAWRWGRLHQSKACVPIKDRVQGMTPVALAGPLLNHT